MGDLVVKAEYQGRSVELDKPFRLPAGSSKKFGVYVKDGDGVKKVTFGDPSMEIRRDDPEARANFRSRHSCDTATDKTSARYWSCRMWEAGESVSDMTKSDNKTSATSYGSIIKFDEDQRMFYGWASVVTENGVPIVDRQGDIIYPHTMEKAATEFMKNIRVGKVMHSGDQKVTFVHSFPLTKEICKAFGLSCDKEGWIVGGYVHDDETWGRVKSGELPALSIGGRARKVEVPN